MKKNLVLLLGLVTMSLGFIACSEDEEKPNVDPTTLDYTSDNAASWANYSLQVATLLKNDAQKLYDDWAGGFADEFKSGEFSGSYNETVQQILDGCIDIANEVGTAKIGDPYNLYISGNTTEALYAVESWYSWHSRDDYANNIKSIANSLVSARLSSSLAAFNLSDADAHSIMTYSKADVAMNEKANEVWQNTIAAWNAIQAIPQPFRSNIGSKKTLEAMDACETLTESLEELKDMIANKGTEEALKPIVEAYVDKVVMPTYRDLAAGNDALYKAVLALSKAPSNATFEQACEAWLEAREPWETSEAFLFGPVDQENLDPNMDSWPLDQTAIVNILTSGKYDALNWADGDSDDAIEAAQSVRGFHTLEYLLFKDGQPRKVN